MINAFEDTGNLPNINIIERAENFLHRSTFDHELLARINCIFDPSCLLKEANTFI